MLRRSPCRQAGAALLEALIALLLSAVALLALAGANAMALRLGKLSQHRVNAALLASDMGERLRANKAGLSGNHYDFTVSWSGQGQVPAPSTSCQSVASFCSAADMAAHDLAHWRWEARRLLPSGGVYLEQADASLSHPGQSLRTADIWVAWEEPAPTRTAAGAADESPTLGECPPGLGLGASTDTQVRCSHVQVSL